MSQKYQTLAEDVVRLVGGKENIQNVYHCQTRLRFKLVDESQADTVALEAEDGVVGVVKASGLYQVVIGTHVADVFEEIAPLVNLQSDEEVAAEKKNPVLKVIEFISGAFTPIIPAISGAGMVKAVLSVLTVFQIVSPESSTYMMLNIFADGVFYFLPILLAFTASQNLKSNPILSVGVAAMMLHPNWSALVATGNPVNFFEIIPFTLTGYASSVIPVLLVVWVQSYIEKFLKRHIPKSVELVVVPLLTFLIMGTLAFSILGPIGSFIGNLLAAFFTFLSTHASWAPALLIGGTLPLMVMFGAHTAVGPIGILQLTNKGYDNLFGPGALVSNIAQATAAAVVAVRTKDKKLKQLATSGSITGFMGITEPILYGVNLPKRYPLIASLIGGAAGGLYAGLTATRRFATGSSGLPAAVMYIGDGTMRHFYNILISLVITIVITAVLTYFLSFKYENVAVIEKRVTESNKPVSSEIAAVVTGSVLPLEEAHDEVFAQGLMGEGYVIEPHDGKIYAPFDGQVVSLFKTKHAIGLLSDQGAEVLIHVGINTVELEGNYFKAFIKEEDSVQKGQLLLEFDLEAIAQAGYDTQTMVIVTNTALFKEVTLAQTGVVNAGQPVLSVVEI
ncbi:beta-glucoside-specific PTS transporter subunit IIABC [Streptococcus merionis]|uniref:beta-glucoside-specific PTS transporter subunit IIABC n=1 Tax=Streptococcus merionis TaxID=400065 RepID=UPI003518A9BA